MKETEWYTGDQKPVRVGFIKTPVNVDVDDGQAFIDFVRFTQGKTKEGKAIADAYFGMKRGNVNVCQIMADYIDWLIVNYWGEAVAEEKSPMSVLSGHKALLIMK